MHVVDPIDVSMRDLSIKGHKHVGNDDDFKREVVVVGIWSLWRSLVCLLKISSSKNILCGTHTQNVMKEKWPDYMHHALGIISGL